MLVIFFRSMLFSWAFLYVATHKPVMALEPDEMLVVINTRVGVAREIAGTYMQQRRIPSDHLVETRVTIEETVTRNSYDEDIRQPVRRKIAMLSQQGSAIRGIVLVYGMPLKVLAPNLDTAADQELSRLRAERKRLQESLAGGNEQAGEMITRLSKRMDVVAGTNKRASVDSELMLVKVDNYRLEGWVVNPYFVGVQNKEMFPGKDEVVLVARLDGPDEKTVYRMIEDTVATEAEGLQGTAYFDARWPKPQKTERLEGYARWDYSLHRAAELVADRMEVKLDAASELIAPGTAPQAALYSGWYSLGRYIDSFTWSRGAIGYHIASAECSTLKKKGSTVWCPQILLHGAAATIGPVYEPYVQGFPLPEVFFGALAEGFHDLGESYLLSLPYISWQMVLIGDPLYRPFRDSPAGRSQ